MIAVLNHPFMWAALGVVMFAVVDYFRRRYEDGRAADLPAGQPVIEPGPRTRRTLEQPDPRVVAWMHTGLLPDESVQRVEELR